MIIFGWGRQTIWTLGAVFKQLCSHCNNEEYWVLMRRTTWFSLFLIPVIPYKTEWLLLCPVCKYGVELKSEQVEKFKPLAVLNQELSDGKITAAVYQERMNVLALKMNSKKPVEVQNASEEIEVEVREIDQSKVKFCGECGKDLLEEGKFCVHCGTKVIEPTT